MLLTDRNFGTIFEKRDIHVHVPEGATPKDGPSAGVAMVTAIISLMTGIPVKREVAMTGEITLRGRVLPIGGLKEKLLAALRAGIKTVIIPDENAKDLTEIPDELKNALDIRPVSRMDEVLKIAFTRPPQPIVWEEEGEERARSSAQGRISARRNGALIGGKPPFSPLICLNSVVRLCAQSRTIFVDFPRFLSQSYTTCL